MRILPVIFFCILLVGCKEETGRILKEDFYDNNQLKYRVIQQDEFGEELVYKEYYETGSIKSSGTITKDGVRIGDWEYYNNNAELVAKGTYKNGSKTGLWKYDDYDIEWAIFEKSDGSFKINYPSDWVKLVLDEDRLVAFYEDTTKTKFSRNFNVLKVEGENDLDSLARENLVEIEDYFGNIEIYNSYKTEINNNSSLLIDLGITHNDTTIFARQTFVKSTEFTLVLNIFSGVDDTRLFNEISYSLFLE